MTATILLVIHIAGGTIALIAGGLAAFSAKGNKLHILSGRLFAIAMLFTAFSAIALSTMRSNYFLLAIGFFTFYLVGSGWLWAQRIPLVQREKMARWMGYFGLSASAYMLHVAYEPESINIVLVVFALIMLSMAIADAFRKKRPKDPLTLHGARMGGAYIAAFTAFVVVNIDLGVWGWLGPTLIGSPLIALGLRKYGRRKKNQGKSAIKRAVEG